MELSFDTKMNILSEFLSGYYVTEDDMYIISSETDCVVWNVMESEGNKDVMKYDEEKESYILNEGVSFYDFDVMSEDDVVCNDWYGDYYQGESEVSQLYKDCDDYTVVIIQVVRSGSVCLDTETFEITSDENTKYNSLPRGFVVINHKVYPLEDG